MISQLGRVQHRLGLAFVLISLAIHGMAYLMLRTVEPDVPPGLPVKRAAVRVQVVKVERPTPPVPGKSGTRRAPPRAAPGREAAVENRPAPSSYTDWLPTSPEDFAEEVGTPASGGKRIADYGASTMQVADEIRVNLDIPLVFRKYHTSGKSLAKISLLEGQVLQIDYLQGDPHFRAVLYDLLRTQRDKFVELLQSMGKDSLRIRLHFQLRQQPQQRVWDETKIALADEVLRIDRTRYVWQALDGSLPQSGMPLPDEYARRSEAYDKAHLRRLRDTPAFMAPLRDYRLP